MLSSTGRFLGRITSPTRISVFGAAQKLTYRRFTAAPNILAMLPTLPVIYEDAHIIVVNKPSNMLTVPGKSEIPKTKPRHQEWKEAVAATHATVSDLASEECAAVLQELAEHPENVPRKEKKFISFLQRSFGVKDDDIAQDAWKFVNIVDEQLNSAPLDPAKKHISATEIVRQSHKKVWNVHRLDCETSGVLVMAFTDDAAAHISAQFREGTTLKRYIAVVSGHVDGSLTHVSLPLRADYENRPLQVVDKENGKESETSVKLVKIEIDETGFPSSVVELTPLTGRTHQLRLHMLHSGHAILGDTMYATGADLAKSDRLLLHASSLEFENPASGKRMRFTAECPFVSEPTIDVKPSAAEIQTVLQEPEVSASPIIAAVASCAP